MYKKQHNTTIVLKPSICTMKVHFLESTNVENANIFSKQGKVLRQTLFPPLMSRFLTNRPLHTAFGIILQNLQNHHQSTGVAANDCAHPSDRISSCEPTSSCPTSPCRSLHRTSQERRAVCGRNHLCLGHHSVSCQPAPCGSGTAWPLAREYEEEAPLPLTDQKQARQFPTKLMAQNLFPEHLKLSPKPSSISNAELFGCHYTG